MRPVRAAHRDQLAQPRGMADRQLQADQRAVGIADEGLQRLDAQRLQQQRDRVGLVGGVDGRVQAAIGAEVIETQHAALTGRQHATGIEEALRPPRRGIDRIRRGMAVRGNAAGEEDHRGSGRTDQLVGEAQFARTGMARGEDGVDGAAQHLRAVVGADIGAGRGRVRPQGPGRGRGGALGGVAFGEAHGTAPMEGVHRHRGGPEDRRRRQRAPQSRHRTHLPGTRRSPQDLAPRPGGCLRSAPHQVAPASLGLSLSRS